MTFGDRLTQAMRAKGYDGKRLAEASGVDAGAISRLRGRQDVGGTRQTTIAALARALEVDSVWLSDGKGEMRAPLQPTTTTLTGSPALEVVLRSFEWPEELDVKAVDHIVDTVRRDAFSDGKDRPESVWVLRLRQLVREEQGKPSKRISHVMHEDPVEERKRARRTRA